MHSFRHGMFGIQHASKRPYGVSAVEINVAPEPPVGGFASKWPTVALHQRDRWNRPAWRRFLFTPWRSAWFHRSGRPALIHFLSEPSGHWQTVWKCLRRHLRRITCFCNPWFEPDRLWSELAVLAIWIGLVSKDPGARTAALDVLIGAIGDGRACPRQMSDVLLRMLPGNWVKLNRVAAALAEASRTSAVHTWFVAETLQAIVAGIDSRLREMHTLLSLLYELLTDLGMTLAPETRSRLENVPGTGKSKKLGVALRKLQPQPQVTKLPRPDCNFSKLGWRGPNDGPLPLHFPPMQTVSSRTISTVS